MSNYSLSAADMLTLETDLLVLPLFAKESHPVLEAIGFGDQAVLEEEGFEYKVGQTLLVRTRHLEELGAKRVLVCGLGKREELEMGAFSQVFAKAAKMAVESKRGRCAVALPWKGEDALVHHAVLGFAQGEYRFDRYKKTSKVKGFERIEEVVFLTPQMRDQEPAFMKAWNVAHGIVVARDMVNEPPMTLTPVEMAIRARNIAKAHGLSATILEEAELKERGFNLLIAVGKGSSRPPRLIHLVYTPKGKVRHTLALVGKGITYDTGGYDLKTGGHMLTMHCDMAGGAAVLGAAEAIGRLRPDGVEVHFVVPAAENSINGEAMRPNEVYTSYGGKTVEILNTDAEGRLVLADALGYIQEVASPETIVDLATLTGACVVALGDYTSGLFVRDEGLYGELSQAIGASGEDFWRMPLTKKLEKQLDSPVADTANIGKRMGGAITAALFLGRFVELERWAHLDIAGPAYTQESREEQIPGATGFGVATLVELAERLGRGEGGKE